jgi:hypothetical protein
MIPFISRMVFGGHCILYDYGSTDGNSDLGYTTIRQQFECGRHGHFLGTLAGSILCMVNHY